jgi:hypothetical protein
MMMARERCLELGDMSSAAPRRCCGTSSTGRAHTKEGHQRVSLNREAGEGGDALYQWKSSMTDGRVDNRHRGVLIADRVRARWEEGGGVARWWRAPGAVEQGAHALQAKVGRPEVAWGGRGAARIVWTLVSERSWTGFPGRGNHATAAWHSKGTHPRVKLTWHGGGCTWRRAQRRTAPAHAHTRQGMRHAAVRTGLVGTLLGPGIAAQWRQRPARTG